jgi:ribosomal protein S19E (S16A)
MPQQTWRNVGRKPRAREAGLSRLQRRILRHLQAQAAGISASGDVRARVVLDVFGVPWHPRAGRRRWTAAQRASYSRALRRLEQRGLLARVNRGRQATGRRTTHVRLWPRGSPWDG